MRAFKKTMVIVGTILTFSLLFLVVYSFIGEPSSPSNEKNNQSNEEENPQDDDSALENSSPILAAVLIIVSVSVGFMLLYLVIKKKSPHYLDVMTREKAEDFIREQLIRDGYDLEERIGSPGYYLHYFEEGGDKYHPRAIIGWNLHQRRSVDAGTMPDSCFIVTYDISLRYPESRSKFLGRGISQSDAEDYIRNIKRGITGQSSEPIKQKIQSPTTERSNAILAKIQAEEDEKAGLKTHA